ncbi:hypothetical protein QBC43DRAFT_285279 [Cladorrhinum sp. PSN259]|nr:hypothetical protein QBC43DRAFT_285279 [Cladorrhinum sp. PSN259]
MAGKLSSQCLGLDPTEKSGHPIKPQPKRRSVLPLALSWLLNILEAPILALTSIGAIICTRSWTYNA